MPEHLVDIAREHGLELRRDGAPHDQQRVDRKERIECEALDGVAPDEAPPLQLLVLRLVLDALQALSGRAIVGQFEDAAQQHRHVLEFRAGALRDRGNHQMREIGVRAAEIEVKFHLGHDHQTSRYGRTSSSNVQASRGCR